MTRTALTLAALTLAPTALAEPVDLLSNPDGLADAPVGLEGGWSLAVGVAGSGDADRLDALILAVGAGHWLSDDFELFLGIASGVIADSDLSTFVFTASWYPWREWVRPYVGGGLTLGLVDAGGLAVFGGGVVTRAGLMVPLSPRVALDWGVELSFLGWDHSLPFTWNLTTTGLGVRWLLGLGD